VSGGASRPPHAKEPSNKTTQLLVPTHRGANSRFIIAFREMHQEYQHIQKRIRQTQRRKR
jgi:hypothetical protein